MLADVVRFGDDLEIDPVAYQLRRSGRPLKLERLPMEILLLLVERRGQLVSREEIIERIWGKDVFLDTDNSINSAVRKIRQALKDDPENPAFIQTVTGKGYRFIAPVPVFVDQIRDFAVSPQVVEVDHSEVLAPEVPAPEPPPAQQPARSLWRDSRIFASAAIVVLLIYGSMYAWRMRLDARSASGAHRAMLAVLPFTNLSSDSEQEYLSDGLTEETITDLSELNPEGLGVIARTSSTAYKGTHQGISQIGHDLGVDFVLEGSVRRDGTAVRISAQLIRVEDQVHLWAHTYERDQTGLLAIENELGRAIAQSVGVRLASSYGTRFASQYVPDAQAYQLYLKGRFYMNKRTWPEVPESSEYFKRAIEKDPGFALAYAGLADSYLARAIQSPGEFDPKAKAAALRALELDGDLAEAHVALGTVEADFEYDWKGAEKEFKRAIDLNPNYAEAHSQYAWTYLTPLGKSDQAIIEMKKALELDPFSRIDNTHLGLTYFYARNYDQAERQLDQAILLNPGFFVTYYHRAWLYSQLGRYAEAIREITRGRLLAGDGRTRFASIDDAALRLALATDGARGFWRRLQIQGDSDDPEIGEFGSPQIYARLGEKDKALAELQRSYEERAPLGTLIDVDPAFDSLRSDPRFKSLRIRMSLNAIAGDR